MSKKAKKAKKEAKKQAKKEKKVIKKKDSIVKKKKKKWYSLLAPKEFSNIEIGETLASDEKELLGRKICISLGVVTRQLRKNNVKVSFVVTNVKEGKATTELIGYNLVPTYVKRSVRKGKSKVDDSLILKTKDDVEVVVKPFVVTRNKVTNSVLTQIRMDMRKELKELFAKEKFDDIISRIIKTDIQRGLKNKLKKIYPLSIVEIRYFKRK